MKKMIKYKLTTQNNTTHNGFKWAVEIKQTILNPTDELCSEGVFHFYDSPEIAILMNHIHANISNPKLWEVEIDKIVAHDGTKGGCHEMTLIKRILIPEISTTQKIAFGIYCTLSVYKDESFTAWAENWLNGTNRSTQAAYTAAHAAAHAAHDAACAAYVAHATRAAVYAACAADNVANAANAGENFLAEFANKAMGVA